jgi:hypothetical protein
MSFWASLFGTEHKTRANAIAQRQSTRESRRETLSIAVRQTLTAHGIPHAWLGAETLPASTSTEPNGLHLRLVIRHTHPDFLANLYSLERAIQAQLLQLDPQYTRWAMGTSWRIEVPLGTPFGDLPRAGFWRPTAPSLTQAVPPKMTAKQRVAQAIQARDSAFAKTTMDAPEFSPTQPMATS